MKSRIVVIVGIDPGLTRCGYAVLDQKGTSTRVLAIGAITTPKTDPTPSRLAQLHDDLSKLLEDFPPTAMAVEKVFFEVNRKSGIAVSQAAGVALALGALSGCEIREYAPTEIKKAVAGWGGADKTQMQDMVRMLLGLEEAPKPADAADAAAVALCHIAHSHMTQLSGI